ncbi:polysaccharide biosynthesis/export family protein [Agaribacterium sp. ZY112]|uniref:polysaccharide biosynthesis/export family protein n=1 Tax=Agaribacterium sp. ZY112 TaxID=3233574 RepID=UPI003524B904
MRFILFLFLFLSSSLFAQESTNGDYRLGVGDSIQVLVYDEPDLTIETVIGDDGDINFPFLGDIPISGKTTDQVQKIITEGLLGDYLIKPSVQVLIVAYRPFYIHGEVKQPGGYAYHPGLTVDQAIALAGGLTERASEQKIFIKHEVSGDVVIDKVDLTYVISPGDTITIKQSFF